MSKEQGSSEVVPEFTRAPRELPDSPAAAQLRAQGHALLAAMSAFNDKIRSLSVRLTDKERASGVGKLRHGEAAELAAVAQYAKDHPALVKGLTAKDGGVDPRSFEADGLLDQLSVHQAARDITTAFDAESAALHTLLGDLAIHQGALARPPLLKAYRIFATLAQHDPDIERALHSVIEFYQSNGGAPGSSSDASSES